MSGAAFDERDLQAAEYVIGALAPQQARALEVLAQSDAAVAAAIASWEERLAPLSDLVAPVEPPLALWRRLALATGIETIYGGPPGARRDAPAARPGPWRSVGLWRAATAASAAAAVALGVLLAGQQAAAPPLVAALTPLGAPGATFLVRVGEDGAATIVAVGTPAVPQGKALELWAVSGQAAPVSMGLLPGQGRARLTLKLPPGTKLLVSQEPEGGSPTKAPTGPVVYGGELTGT